MFSFLKKLFKRKALLPKVTKELIIALYNKHPKLCKECKVPLPYAKRDQSFCCVSHGVSFNNRLRNTALSRDAKWLKRVAVIEASGLFPCNPRTAETNNKVAKKYLIHKNGAKCLICGLKKWGGKPILLIVDHIDGDPTNSKIDNFRLVCPNCDSQLPTYAGKNKGHGRLSRQYNYWANK